MLIIDPVTGQVVDQVNLNSWALSLAIKMYAETTVEFAIVALTSELVGLGVGLAAGRLVAAAATRFAARGAVAAKGVGNLAIRSDIVLGGGRGGGLVKNLTGPANSVLKGSEGRIFITNDVGKVIWDVTAQRAKPVIPGRGFGSFEYGDVSTEFLNLIKKVWGQ
jgi:hypothetical protein